MTKTQDYKQTTDRAVIAHRAKQLLKVKSIPCHAIAAAIRAEFPQAKTTPRSVATMASVLRKHGETIAKRKPGPISA